jgi:large subunit ribosomal protein L1
MGKVRKVVLGDEEQEAEQKRKAEARRETKKAKKADKEETGEETPKAEAAPEADAESKKEKKEHKKKDDGEIRPKHGKKYTEMAALVDRSKLYPVAEAIGLVKKTSMTKFDGTVELHINLNTQAMDGKKDLRGDGTGKTIRVVVADDAVVAAITEGKIEFDILVAHPSMMPKLARVARILGPRGLMPNPKTGTVTTDVERRVKELSQGQVTYKNEPDNPIIHMSVGKVSFTESDLTDNIMAVVANIGRNRIAKATVTSTMGPGIRLAV